jgi:hypothetical protein
MGHQSHAEDRLGVATNFGNTVSEFDPTTFASATGVNLSFDHPFTPTKFLRDGNGLVNTKTDAAFWNRHAVLPEYILGLIFMDFHYSTISILITGILYTSFNR